MKPEEMMLGDWISFNGEPVKVVHIVSGINEDDYDPIPLTEELLIKNGWHRYYFGAKDTSDKVSINYELKNDHTLFLSHYPDEDCFCSAFGLKRIEFRYVHQLQHALRLCGIDKEIVL